MAEDSKPDKEDQTEDASEHKIRKSQEKGDFPISKDLTTAVMLAGSMISLFLIFPFAGKSLSLKLKGIIDKADFFSLTENHHSQIAWVVFKDVVFDFLSLTLIFILCAVGATYIQTKLTKKKDALKPKLEKISFIQGVKRLFSVKSLAELIKSVVKLFVISTLLYLLLSSELQKIPEISAQPLALSLQLMWGLAFKLFMVALIFQVFIGGGDYLYQRYEYFKRLKMTKKELKDEFKETDGDPHVKSKRRQLQQKAASGRMMEDVPTATVIITNPTHYAVALKYNPIENKAPVVVAKGKDNVAQKIRELGLKNWITIIENPPLARSLYKLPLKKEIPAEFYQAVAEIIKYVFKKKQQK